MTQQGPRRRDKIQMENAGSEASLSYTLALEEAALEVAQSGGER